MTACDTKHSILVEEVDVNDIRVNPHQPRRHFSTHELEELANSIVEVGLIHPPLVRRMANNCYELISGERRFRAAQLAGLEQLQVIIKDADHSLSAQQALVENIQRVDLNPMEIAKALKNLMDDFALNQDQLARRVGKKRSTVANYLRLLGLPKAVQESVDQGELTMGHAKAIMALQGFEKQMLLYETIRRDALSVREAEKAAQRIGQKAKKQKLVYADRDFYLEQLAEQVQSKLGTKVSIQGKGKKGRITIDYYNLDDLDRLLEIFGINNSDSL